MKKNIMKKLTLIAIALVATLTGCNNTNTATSASVKDTTEVSTNPVEDKATTENVQPKIDTDDLIVLKPDLTSNKPLNLSDKDDHKNLMFPNWNAQDIYEDPDNGSIRYNINIGADGRPYQHLFKDLPVRPTDMNEFGRLILVDVNFDGHTDLLVCLGRYDMEEYMYFDAWIWDTDYENFSYDENFRNYAEPAISKSQKKVVENVD